MKKKLNLVLLIATLLFAFASCTKDGGTIPVNTFVLVHGAWQGPYVWENIKSRLENSGQKVIVVELPGHGGMT